jgi:aminoglycoside phosphotransferase (APT) family kinase protein
LAKIHSVDLLSVGLERLGKHGGFFDRQIRTFNAVSESQAGVEDIETKVPVGYPPHFHDIVSFLSIRETQPPDRSTLIHGDYKIDNIVFHKTKPCVIGILDWEMGAIGHPLSDICNVTAPLIAPRLSRISANYSPGTHGLPSRQDCIRWYQEVSGWVPTPDLLWGDAFYAFKSSVIMQGIAARYSRRQASSALAKEYGELMVPFAVLAKKRAEEIKKNAEDRASLSYDGASKM